MAVIASKILLASVSFIEPTASATYIEARASSTYIEAKASYSYIQAIVTAEVTMPDVLSVDVVTPTDLVTLSTTKGLSDSTPPIDALAIAFARTLSDSQSTADAIANQLGKVLSDIQSFSDSTSISFGRILADSTTQDDLATLSSVKALADSIDAPVDDLANVVYKALDESQSLSDVIEVILIFIREFTETLAVPDTPSIAFTPDTFTDSIGQTDTTTLENDKSLAESTILIDNMDGDLEYTIIKVVGEVLLNTDLSAVAFSTNKDDNLTTSSSGTLTMQDYCDITYFLTDYVGTSLTFT